MMDVSQLKTVVHVAELGSLSKAADRLGIAQPALSRQVRQLEKELGAHLFDRHGRGMVPTRVGRDVLDCAARVMAELDAIRDCASKEASSLRGVVTIGMTPTVASIVTVPLVTQVRLHHPQLAIRFTSAFSGHLIDWLQRGELEVVVSYDPQPLRTLRVEPVMMEDLLYIGVGDKLSLETPVSFTAVSEGPLILPSSRHGLRAIIDECARKVGVVLDASLEADSFQTMIDLVQGGFGSTILPLAPIYHLIGAGRLCAAPIVDPHPRRKLVVAYSTDRPVSRAARFVGEAFRRITGELVAQGIWAGEML